MLAGGHSLLSEEFAEDDRVVKQQATASRQVGRIRRIMGATWMRGAFLFPALVVLIVCAAGHSAAQEDYLVPPGNPGHLENSWPRREAAGQVPSRAFEHIFARQRPQLSKNSTSHQALRANRRRNTPVPGRVWWSRGYRHRPVRHSGRKPVITPRPQQERWGFLARLSLPPPIVVLYDDIITYRARKSHFLRRTYLSLFLLTTSCPDHDLASLSGRQVERSIAEKIRDLNQGGWS